MVKGPDSESFVDYVITRDATEIKPMRAKYVVLCNNMGGVLNDPVLLRLSKDEFWFSLADSDVGMYLQGVNHDNRFNVVVDEIDVCPIQIQGPKSLALMKDLVGGQVNLEKLPFYGLAEAKIRGRACIFHGLDSLENRALKFICAMPHYMRKICGMPFWKQGKNIS